MSEFFINTCNVCKKNDHDEHIIFPDNNTCQDCHINKPEDCHSCGTVLSNDIFKYPEGTFCGECQKTIIKNNKLEYDDDDNDVFGEPTTYLCDACGESIDGSMEQVHYPNIYCPDCLIGIGKAYEDKANIEYRNNINKIAEYMPLIYEKLREIERNTNPTMKSFHESEKSSSYMNSSEMSDS